MNVVFILVLELCHEALFALVCFARRRQLSHKFGELLLCFFAFGIHLDGDLFMELGGLDLLFVLLFF